MECLGDSMFSDSIRCSPMFSEASVGAAAAGMAVAALGVRFDTVSYSDFAANFTDFRQLVRARSRLYRSRFLQPNTHFAALFDIFKIIIPSHRSQFNILANFRRKVFKNFQIFIESLLFFTMFIEFCTDVDENLSEFRQILQRLLRFH